MTTIILYNKTTDCIDLLEVVLNESAMVCTYDFDNDVLLQLNFPSYKRGLEVIANTMHLGHLEVIGVY